MIHILRNPHGYSDDEVRAARLWAADELDALRGLLREVLDAGCGEHWLGTTLHDKVIEAAKK